MNFDRMSEPELQHWRLEAIMTRDAPDATNEAKADATMRIERIKRILEARRLKGA